MQKLVCLVILFGMNTQITEGQILVQNYNYVQCIICEAYVPYSIASPPPTQPPSPTPTSSPPPTQPPPQASSDAGAIAGGVIGGLIGVIIIVLIVIVIAYLIWKKKNSPSKCDCSGTIVAI